MPATTVVPRARATRATSVANAPSSPSAYPLTSEPASPKSRANASGSTTRSVPSGTSSASRSRFVAGSSPEASWTRARRRVVMTPACHAAVRDWPDAAPLRTRRRFAAVVLAGGSAVRLGGADKASVEYAGRTLLAHALDAVAEADEVVVVGDAVPTDRPVTFTRESPPVGGPVAGLLAGRDALARPAASLVVLAVDMPRVGPGTVRRLRAAAAGHDGAFLVGPDGRRQLAAVLAPRPWTPPARSPGPSTAWPCTGWSPGSTSPRCPPRARRPGTWTPGRPARAARPRPCGPVTRRGPPRTAPGVAAHRQQREAETVNLHDWIDELSDVLDVDTELDEGLVLDLARVAAHNVERPAAPVTTYLLGFAAGQRGADPQAIESLAARAQLLAEEWDRPADAPDPDDIDDEIPDDSTVDHAADAYED